MGWVVSKLLGYKYEVNENAEIRSIKTKRVLRKQFNVKHGRYYVGVSVNGKILNKKVSRVVAEAFLPNPNNYSDVNHINGNKTDDRLSNLEWCSRKENIRHSISFGLRKKKYKTKNKSLINENKQDTVQ